MYVRVDVYHANRMPDGSLYDWIFHKTPPSFPDECAHVARMVFPEGTTTVEALNWAYRLTNHIDKPWWENDLVVRVGPETRSTSIGDVVVVHPFVVEPDPEGWARHPGVPAEVAYRVMPSGFKPVGEEDAS